MFEKRDGRVPECVVLDLNTQRDFCIPTGAYPVVNLDTLIPAMRKVVAWVKRNHAPVISCIDSHRMWELTEYGQPIHCVDGTFGQRKLDFTILPARTRVETDNTLAVPFNLFKFYQQVIFSKRTDDLLANPKADRFLTQLPIRDYVVFGNGLEDSVKAVVLGLIARSKSVSVVVDACGYWNKSTADLALRQMSAKGASVISAIELIGRRLSRRHRYPITVHRLSIGKNGNGRPAGSNGNGNGKHKNGSLPINESNATIESDDGYPDSPGNGETT